MSKPRSTSIATWVKTKIIRHGPPFLFFVCLTLLLHWQLVRHLTTHFFGRPFEDVLESHFLLSWMRAVVFDGAGNAFYNPNIFYPEGWQIASGAQPVWYYLTLAPLTQLVGEIAAYNLAILGLLTLASFGVYLLTYQFTQRRLASFIAGCVYLVAPTITIHIPGHLHTVISSTLLPYACLFTMLALNRSGRRRWIWTLLAGVALALTFLGHWTFIFIASLPLTAFVLFYWDISWRNKLTILAAILLLAVILVMPFALVANQARQAMFAGADNFSPEVADSNNISMERLLLPNPFQPLWRDTILERFPVTGEHQFIAIGYATLILTLLGILTSRIQRLLPIIAFGLVALILGLGLTLHLGGERVVLEAPDFVSQLVEDHWWGPRLPPGKIAIPLPGLLFYRFLPFYSAMRVASRFTIPLMVAIGVLAGLGTNRLLRMEKPLGYVALAILGALILFEGLSTPYSEFTPAVVNERSADAWLAAQDYPTPLIEYPNYVVKNAMVSQSKHGQPLVNGYMSISPNFLREAQGSLGRWPSEAAITLLRNWDVKLIVISGSSQSKQFTEETLPQIEMLEELCLVQTFNDAFLELDRTYIFQILDADSDCQVG